MTQPIWVTPAGSIGTFSALVPISVSVEATPVLPATIITYSLISGSLPQGLTLSSLGVITGTPLVNEETNFIFVVRATDNEGNIRDRTFTIALVSDISPVFTTLPGNIITTYDSIWREISIEYFNPVDTNQVAIRLIEGNLPPGMEINTNGIIRGYARPPTLNENLELVETAVTSITSNKLTCLSTTGFTEGRLIQFSGAVFGGVNAGQTYYILAILNESEFTISSTLFGDEISLTDSTGYMDTTLSAISVDQPVVETYKFTLRLESELGNDEQTYDIVVINQNAPVTQGGFGPSRKRVPALYNTRPASFNITDDTPYYGYYLLPNNIGRTYSLDEPAYMGKFTSDNLFSFKLIGYDFDEDDIAYSFADLPLGLVGNELTGWITGMPVIANNSISDFYFSAAVYKQSDPTFISPYIKFYFRLTNGINDSISWTSPSQLGVIENSSVSTLKVEALAAVDVQYRLVSGNLPPNLTLLSNGSIVGTVAYQPTNILTNENENDTFTFVVEAFSIQYPIIKTSKEFTIVVTQEYIQPTDTLYIKCTPSIDDRNIIRSLLTSEELIPTEYLYKPDDKNFGKAANVTYIHAYGIHSNDLESYVASVTKNHYWRNITLGEIKTAVAKNDQGEVIYEVVYSSIIDNLVNPEGISVNKQIIWPSTINLNLGPWYTSITDIYTSYEDNYYYTSLSPGYARTLYPNSLDNMRQQVSNVLGQDANFNLYPKWMTSQQENGSTLGFTPAWVICYTKPGYSEIIKSNIENNWKTPIGKKIKLNEINFKIDRFAVDKSLTYDYDSNLSPTTWTGLPSATPEPDPKDSKDFYVLYPRDTILPDESE